MHIVKERQPRSASWGAQGEEEQETKESHK